MYILNICIMLKTRKCLVQKLYSHYVKDIKMFRYKVETNR